LFEEAAMLIVQSGMGSTSMIQRRMKLGYNRAGRLMDQLEAAGIVGSSQGSKAREVLIKSDMELQQILDQMK
jgi:S-DNA-T family DNA segregation ATPase FtsK/SpoIIIE